jgi:hypothetical protein
MTEIEYKLSDLINFSSQQKPIDFETAFKSIMIDKIGSAIDNKKLEVAQSIFNTEPEEYEAND